MRVFVAGASGALGSRLVPQLIDAGHEVVGSHNSPTSAERLRALGATPVMLDLLDASAVRKAVLENEPEAIVDEATALADVKFSRNMDKVTAETSELRTKGTDALLAAAREAGVRRFVAQSVAAFSRYARQGGPIKTENDPVDPDPPANLHRTFAALNHLERVVTDSGGIALRYGAFYGAANDVAVDPVRRRQFPIVGDGGGIWAWIQPSTRPSARPWSRSTRGSRRRRDARRSGGGKRRRGVRREGAPVERLRRHGVDVDVAPRSQCTHDEYCDHGRDLRHRRGHQLVEP